MSNSIKYLNEENYSQTINGEGVVLVDYFAEWCGPCKLLGPVLEQLAEELKEKAVICKINVDEQPTLASNSGVQSIPTVFIYKDGAQVEKFSGFRTKAQLVEILNKYI